MAKSTTHTAAKAPSQRRRGQRAMPDAGPAADRLQSELEELGLGPYEARILLALMRVGQGTVADLYPVASIPRTSAYPALQMLSDKGLAVRKPGPGMAVWTAPPPDIVFERLQAALERANAERMSRHVARSARVRELIADTLPADNRVSLPYVHLLHGPSEMKTAYERLLIGATSHFVMFTRPPYAWSMPDPNPIVLATLARGVRARVLYQAAEWNDPNAADFRAEMEEYHRAGTEARLALDLPIKLVVVDDSRTLVAMPDPVAPELTYPMTMLIEHPGYARVHAAGFERLWLMAQPLPPADVSHGDRPAQIDDAETTSPP